MSTYRATLRWQAGNEDAGALYSRVHRIEFDGLAVVGSAAQHNAPEGTTEAHAVHPEELFVASLAQCHMLWFLDLANQAGVKVSRYEDRAEGVLAKAADGKHLVMTVVMLRPRVDSDASPEILADLHHRAHEVCFIANSVKSEVRVEPAF